ncbi:hypothetical protein M422DRAFT_51135 [Sphaerobolus stellatus SS14]|uniref:Uncharacterized protein n=1 Tax=Sphaerobolus stellatus (strain SS14) TaxID=990650 RepID=A0A0C9VG84_SPHS4|nr:hypothetical protein M422DRAFT_51135 [Sphaerobolus stellatus SS14]
MSNYRPVTPEPCGYWEILALPAVSPFSESIDVVSAWWKILSHYFPAKQIRIVPRSLRVAGQVVQTLVVEAICVRHYGMSKSKTTQLFILEYRGPECLPLDGSFGEWESQSSSFRGSLEEVLHHEDLSQIYVALAVGEYVKFWKVDMIDGREGSWQPLVDDPEGQDTLDSYDVADWHDKLKIHKFMTEIAGYVHGFW